MLPLLIPYFLQEKIVNANLKKKQISNKLNGLLPDITCPVTKSMAKEFILICETRDDIAPTEATITENRYGGYDFRIYNSPDDLDKNNLQYKARITTYPYPDDNLYVPLREFQHPLNMFPFRFNELFMGFPHKNQCPINVALIYQDVLFAGIVAAVMKRTEFNPNGTYRPELGLDTIQNQLKGCIRTTLFEGSEKYMDSRDKEIRYVTVSDIATNASNTASNIQVASCLSFYHYSNVPN